MNEYSQMVADLAKPGEDIIASLTPIKAHTLHMAIGLMGEVVELKEDQIADATPDSTVLEELGDIEFYLEGLCQSMSMTLPASGATFPYPLSVDRLSLAAGNMLDLVKKMVIYNKDIALMEFVTHVISVREALDCVENYYGISQVEAQEHNLNKLLKGKTARYKDGTYSDKAAQERADKQKLNKVDCAGVGDNEGFFISTGTDRVLHNPVLYSHITNPTELNDLLSLALRALCLTRDYVGEEKLPAIDGWEWYEAGKKLAEHLGNEEWANEFRQRINDYKSVNPTEST